MQQTRERTEIMKRILAVILSLAMVLCMMPGTAFAVDTQKTDLSKAEITLKTDDFTYDGKEKNAEIVSVKPQAATEAIPIETLTDAGCKITYSNNKNAGTATVTLTAPADNETYTGSTSTTYTIKAKQINSTTITEGYRRPVTASEEIKASDITLYDSETGLDLKADTDFELESAPIAATGDTTRSVTITGKNNYTGEKVVVFTLGKDIDDTAIKVEKSSSIFTYNGQPQTFSWVKVYDANKELTLNRDYVISYENNVDAGANAKLIIEGRGTYAGKKSIDFEIKQRSIRSVSIESIPNQLTNVTPHPIIKDTGIKGTPTLQEGKDYILESRNNSEPGTATLYIHAIADGNYKDFATATFYVRKELRADIVISPPKSFPYTGSVITPIVTVKAKDPKETYLLNRDYVIEGGSNVNANTYTYYIVGIGNYAGKYGPYTYIITPQSLNVNADVTLYDDSFIYDGKEKKPSVTVRCNGRTLTNGIDYTVRYSNNIRIGTASVTITGKGNYTGSITKTFRIIGKDLSQVSGTLSQTSYNYDGLEKKPTVTLYDGTKKLTSGVDYTVSYRNNKNAGTGEVIVTGKGNYGGTKTLTFRIIGKSQTVTTRYTRYTKTLKSAPFNLQAGHDGDGTLVYKTSDPSVATVSATGTVTITGTGKATITVSTTGNVKYDPASKAVYINVKPLKPVIKVTSPAKKQIKVMITKVKGATKYQVKYGANGVYHNKYIVHNENSYAKVYTKIKNRVSGKTYEVKVRAYKTMADGTKVWGDWTTVKKIKAK